MEVTTETLLAIARNLRNAARNISGQGEAIQTSLFGPEPRDVAGYPNSPSETVESVLRETLSIINDAGAQFARTLGRIGDDQANKAMAEKAAYGGSGYATNAAPGRW